jgi:hypothetical protein
MRLEWSASLSASCLHAAACVQEGLPLSDDELIPALSDPIEQLLRELRAAGLRTDEALPQLVALAGEVENNRQLAELAFTKLWGKSATHDSSVNRLAGCIADLEAALLGERPGLMDELDIRSRPLREQWESHGPGLLRQMVLLTEDPLLVESASVVLVAPVVGGHGRSHLLRNRVTFEAMLVNPHPHLPETLRLGWLLSQLNLDLPMFSDNVPPARRLLVFSLATLPLVLAAAEILELAKLDAETLRSALACWHLSPELPADIDDRLLAWWNTYQGSSTRWATALAALDAMLAA